MKRTILLATSACLLLGVAPAEAAGCLKGALVGSIAAMLAFAAEDLAHADELAALLVEDVKAELRNNWDYVRSPRPQAVPAGRG